MRNLLAQLLATSAIAAIAATISIERGQDGFTVTTPRLCYAANLIERSSPDGEPEAVHSWISTCPWTPVFTVQNVKPSAFFQMEFLDNGILPTPSPAFVFQSGASAHVGCPMVFQCDDSNVSYRLKRNGEVIYEGTRAFIFEPFIPTGSHSYSWQAFSGTNESWWTAPITITVH